jgi:hypothetical protein
MRSENISAKSAESSMNLIQQFPNISRRERRNPVDHGPDQPGLLMRLLIGIGMFCAFAGICIVLLILMGLLKALGVKEL